jgi:dienelactone hydrolase
MKLVRWALGSLLVLSGVLAAAFLLRAPDLPASDSESAHRLALGPYVVGSSDHVFVDRSRPTAPNRDFAGAPERTLVTTLWYPADAPSPHPFVVYSHGFMSMRSENAPLAELLASHGYVVVSADFPLTHQGAPGGPNVADAVNQPGDVRFLIDQVLGWGEDARPFPGEIDRERIGAIGLSLGGLTSTLVTFHPRLRDPRITAAVSIAGPAAMFSPAFFATADVPFLMIAGTKDAMIPYGPNAEPIPQKVRRGALLSIEGGSHTGFARFADGFPLRLLGNPDRLGCFALARNLAAGPRENPFAGLGGADDGIVFDAAASLPCSDGAPADALAAGRQLMITRLAALAFFESQFARDGAERAAQATFLGKTLTGDFAEASFRSAGEPQSFVGTRGSRPAAR